MNPLAIVGAVAAGIAAIGTVGHLLIFGSLPFAGTSSSGGGPLGWDDVRAFRATVPPLPTAAKRYGAGLMYMGTDDVAHVAWLKKTLGAMAEGADEARARGILAFAALLGREGTTASLNTYDNQVITWGVGFAAKSGLMGEVMERLGEDATVYLGRAGFSYPERWEAFDADGKLATGTAALEVARNVPEILAALVHVAKDAATREDVLRAQLETFLAHAGRVDAIREPATQALVNFVAHLRHWAPGYANGALEWAAGQLPGAPHPARDVKLAELVTRRFYEKASGAKWQPDWRQLKSYLRHMVADGLPEFEGNPLLAAAEPPGGKA